MCAHVCFVWASVCAHAFVHVSVCMCMCVCVCVCALPISILDHGNHYYFKFAYLLKTQNKRLFSGNRAA